MREFQFQVDELLINFFGALVVKIRVEICVVLLEIWFMFGKIFFVKTFNLWAGEFEIFNLESEKRNWIFEKWG